MTFATDAKADAQRIVYAEHGESVLYGEATITAIVDREAAEEAVSEDGLGAVTGVELIITDNSDSENYPGVAAPVFGDVVTIDSLDFRVDRKARIGLGTLWQLHASRFDRNAISHNENARRQR